MVPADLNCGHVIGILCGFVYVTENFDRPGLQLQIDTGTVH